MLYVHQFQDRKKERNFQKEYIVLPSDHSEVSFVQMTSLQFPDGMRHPLHFMQNIWKESRKNYESVEWLLFNSEMGLFWHGETLLHSCPLRQQKEWKKTAEVCQPAGLTCKGLLKNKEGITWHLSETAGLQLLIAKANWGSEVLQNLSLDDCTWK